MAKTSLEQWGILAAVIDEGGFAQAAEALHKSQSAISYGVARLRGAEQVPGLAAQVIEAGLGRKISHDVSFTGPRSARQAWQGRAP